MPIRVLVFLRLAVRCGAVTNEKTAADNSTVAPAAANVSADSSAAPVQLFSAETAQLSDEVLANLTNLQLSNISLFSFDANDTSSKARRSLFGSCKTYPGDLLWPSTLLWDVFDLLLGGALIQTKPFASPCYDDFGNYNAAQCATVTNNWSNDSYLSYVLGVLPSHLS